MNKRAIVSGDAIDWRTNSYLFTMNRAHTDDTGRVFPAGTQYTVKSAGYDGVKNTDYQTLSINGEQVTFRRSQRTLARLSPRPKANFP